MLQSRTSPQCWLKAEVLLLVLDMVGDRSPEVGSSRRAVQLVLCLRWLPSDFVDSAWTMGAGRPLTSRPAPAL